MKSQLQRLEPKLVEETKEKVEAEIFPPPPPSDDEFRQELRTEWESKMREILHQQQTAQKHKMASMEQQLDEVKFKKKYFSKTYNFHNRKSVNLSQI